MSWWIHLEDDRGHDEGEWNGTHNIGPMVNAALEEAGVDVERTWWRELNGMTGPDGAAFLHKVVTVLEADPERWREMNPSNGWGDYDELLVKLKKMISAVPEWPTVWTANG